MFEGKVLNSFTLLLTLVATVLRLVSESLKKTAPSMVQVGSVFKSNAVSSEKARGNVVSSWLDEIFIKNGWFERTSGDQLDEG